MNFNKKILASTVALAVSTLYMPIIQAGTTSFSVSATMITALIFDQVSDLDFGEAISGETVKTIPPGTGENAENASFDIKGEPFHLYTVNLPANGSVFLTNGGNSIGVDDFTYFTAKLGAANSGGQVESDGKDEIFVGATRGSVGTSLGIGTYNGTFFVEIIY